MSIYDILKAKTWESRGTVLLSPGRPPRTGYYPSIGVKFEPVNPNFHKEPKHTVHAWVQPSTGAPHDVALTTRERGVCSLQFKIHEPASYPSHLPPGKFPPQGAFDKKFKASFEDATFFEHDESRMVSKPILVTDPNINEGKTTAVVFVIELYKDDAGDTKMVQRAYWQDNYLGTYCCG